MGKDGLSGGSQVVPVPSSPVAVSGPVDGVAMVAGKEALHGHNAVVSSSPGLTRPPVLLNEHLT